MHHFLTIPVLTDPALALPSLHGNHVSLLPLARTHAPELVCAAADGELWNMTLTVVPDATTIDAYIDKALDGARAGTVMPYVIVDAARDRIVGTTRFWKVDRANRKLEIGHTWLSASAQRTAINTEAKLLLLTHAFEVMHCVRVQFTTDVLNARSRAAILRLGAKQEGIVRHERIMPDGRKRDSVRFSIIDPEWPEVRDGLLARLSGAAGR